MDAYFPPSESIRVFHKRPVNSLKQDITKKDNVYIFKSHVWDYSILVSQKEW